MLPPSDNETDECNDDELLAADTAEWQLSDSDSETSIEYNGMEEYYNLDRYNIGVDLMELCRHESVRCSDNVFNK